MGAPFLAKQPRWAAASIPSARPLRTGPTRLSQTTAQFFSHGKTMVRGGTRAHHRDGRAGMDVPEQRSIPFDVEPGRGCLHIIQATRPIRVTRQKGTSRHVKLRSSPVLEPVTLNVAQTVRRPSQRLAQAFDRPLLRADQGRWLGRGKACVDQPCGRCPSQGNRSRATTTPRTSSRVSTRVLARQRWLRVRFRAIGAPADPSPPAAAPERA